MVVAVADTDYHRLEYMVVNRLPQLHRLRSNLLQTLVRTVFRVFDQLRRRIGLNGTHIAVALHLHGRPRMG